MFQLPEAIEAIRLRELYLSKYNALCGKLEAALHSKPVSKESLQMYLELAVGDTLLVELLYNQLQQYCSDGAEQQIQS